MLPQPGWTLHPGCARQPYQPYQPYQPSGQCLSQSLFCVGIEQGKGGCRTGRHHRALEILIPQAEIAEARPPGDPGLASDPGLAVLSSKVVHAQPGDGGSGPWPMLGMGMLRLLVFSAGCGRGPQGWSSQAGMLDLLPGFWQLS